MATIVLQAAGAFLGGVFGPVGSAIGSAIGAMAGYSIDQALFQGSRKVEGPRLGTARPFMAEEGVPIPRVYGTMRVGGNLIWATRFQETSTTERQGGKGGGPKVTTTTYAYFGNFAFALCDGEIAGVRRIWADGREIDLDDVTVRIYNGSETQLADPLISAKQGGKAPAYRGTAYAVFEHFALGSYGNRIPQFQFEVMRPVGRLNANVKSVALLPGSTEYGLSPRVVTHVPSPGVTQHVNRNVLHGSSDLIASLDELQALCPNLEEIALVVAWFGDDLRVGSCKIRPKVTQPNPDGLSDAWQVAGVTRADAQTVSHVNGVAAYGGTPADWTVVACIAEIKRRGLRVALYPFVMMDVPPGNGLADPYGGTEQSAFPWRGRITCHPAPGMDGSPDKSSAIPTAVDAFCGASDDWGYRRLVLHYAQLASSAGGVDTFLIGSEMRGVSTLRNEANGFPFVDALCDLAGDVRSILGSGTKISYGADWSEYFGYQPAGGSGDVFYHIDPLWAHSAIDAIGIDNYMPIADWRDSDVDGANPDGFRGAYDVEGLQSQIAGGEGFDWFYESDAARAARTRTPITDGTHGKPWVYRYKDLKSWWENQHFDRIGGVEISTSSAWVPCSKPIWFTELGCPAVDKGPNQPNVFPDPKSSENALPHFSNGGRADEVQAAFLTAHFNHWGAENAAQNPVSSVYGGQMVDPSRITLWAWDARPFPAFPRRSDVWADGANWRCGHWLNGRLCGLLGADLVAAILKDHGLPKADVRGVGGAMSGYIVEAPDTARAALEPLVTLFGINVTEVAGKLTFASEGAWSLPANEIDDLVLDERSGMMERLRAPDADLPDAAELSYIDPFADYQSASARKAHPRAPAAAIQRISFPGSMHADGAFALVADLVERRHVARDAISFAVPANAIDVAPGKVVQLKQEQGGYDYLVTEVEQGLVRQVRARRVSRRAPTPRLPIDLGQGTTRPSIAGAPHVLMLDLPLLPGDGAFQDQFRIAAFAEPWRMQAVYASPEAEGFRFVKAIEDRATVGELVEPLTHGFEGRIDRAATLTVKLYGGELSSVSLGAMLNGANVAAVKSADDIWEVLQFAEAEEVAPSIWELRSLLRGQLGTNDAAALGAGEGADFVLLNRAVVPAGLAPEQAGLPLNWRIGPAGKEQGSSVFVQRQELGGIRSRLPLSPVHLRRVRRADGAIDFSWIRRGRVDADTWLGEEIPLEEDTERYRVVVALADGQVLRTAETDTPSWRYSAEFIDADVAERPALMHVSVRQVSTSVGVGIAANLHFNLT